MAVYVHYVGYRSLLWLLCFGVLRSYHVESPKKANSNLYEGVHVVVQIV